MKKLYNTIENNLKKGLQVVVKDLRDNTYSVISNLRDSDGKYRMSSWFDSIKDAKQAFGACYGRSKEWWNALDLEIVEVYRPDFEPFKVGDKVRLLDSIKKTEDWEEAEEDFKDMTGVISEVHICLGGTDYWVNNLDSDEDGWCIGHEYLAPLVEEEDNVALEAIKLLEEKGYKIIKN